MPNPSDNRAIIEAERRLLRALCQAASDESIRETAKKELQDYRWRDPIHQVVFTCLGDLPPDNPMLTREQLPARVARKGFPDVPWEDFFQPLLFSRQEAEDLIRQLRYSNSSVA